MSDRFAVVFGHARPRTHTSIQIQGSSGRGQILRMFGHNRRLIEVLTDVQVPQRRRNKTLKQLRMIASVLKQVPGT